MQSALAKGLGVAPEKVQIDFDAKTASVDCGEKAPDQATLTQLAKVMAETHKYTAEPAN